jgi:hypothetical protein
LVFIFALNKKISSYTEKYPVLDCPDIRENYGSELQKYAVMQWSDLIEKEDANK